MSDEKIKALLVSTLDEDGDYFGWDDPATLVETVMAETDNDDVCVFGNESRALIDLDWAWLFGVVHAQHAEALLVTVPDHVTDWTSWLDDLLSEVPEYREAPFGVKVKQLHEDEAESLIADHNDTYIDYHRALTEEYGAEVLAEQRMQDVLDDRYY